MYACRSSDKVFPEDFCTAISYVATDDQPKIVFNHCCKEIAPLHVVTEPSLLSVASLVFPFAIIISPALTTPHSSKAEILGRDRLEISRFCVFPSADFHNR